MCPVAGDTTELQSQFLQLHLGGTRSAMDRTAFCVFWAYLLWLSSDFITNAVDSIERLVSDMAY